MMSGMAFTDELVENNNAYAHQFEHGDLGAAPTKALAVVMCMDARLRAFGFLGLQEGDAHIIRNAGGAVTDDVIRSLIISQRLLGTREIALVHHTDCGMAKFSDEEMKAVLQEETGIRPPFAFETFGDVDADVRQSMARIRATPFIPHKEVVRGYVYDVHTGTLREVLPEVVSADR